MKTILKVISVVGLLLTVGPSFLVFSQTITLEAHKTIALIGTLMWIATAPFWINKSKLNKE